MYSATFEALTALLPNVPVFWALTPHRFVNNYRIFEETRRSIREEEGITFFSLFTPSKFSLFFPRSYKRWDKYSPVETWWHTVTQGRGSDGETGEWNG